VLRQQGAHGRNGIDRSLLILPRAERGLHGAADTVPFGLTNPGGNTPVSHDLDPAIHPLDVNQNARIFRRVPNPEPRENLNGPLPSGQTLPQITEIETGLNRKPDLAPVTGLGPLHGGLNGSQNP
jgi:hypothetical protein